MNHPSSREVDIEPAQTALLFVDVQNYNCTWDGGEYAQLSAQQKQQRYGYFFRQFNDSALPNMVRLQQACRRARIEVTYTVIESMTADGRDRSLDYKITGFNVPKGSPDARVVEALTPGDDEIVFPKTSSSVFISTNIDYVLRNLGVRYLIIAGCLTDQCVDSAVRDACDLGYLVTRADRCLRHADGRAARLVAAQQPRLLPAAEHATAARGDRAHGRIHMSSNSGATRAPIEYADASRGGARRVRRHHGHAPDRLGQQLLEGAGARSADAAPHVGQLQGGHGSPGRSIR